MAARLPFVTVSTLSKSAEAFLNVSVQYVCRIVSAHLLANISLAHLFDSVSRQVSARAISPSTRPSRPSCLYRARE